MKPILFNTEMVRAILDNRKSVTRRVVKGAEKYTSFVEISDDAYMSATDRYGEEYPKKVDGTWATFEWDGFPDFPMVKSSYQEGDILYVRETWQIHDLNPSFCMMIRYKADNVCNLQVKFEPSRYDKFEKFHHKNGWQSPYFMPREAARIFLKVTGVRVERLQEIDGHEVLAEGINNEYSGSNWEDMQRIDFEDLWNSTIKPKDLDKYGWEANPWVWVIEFERISKEKVGRRWGIAKDK